MYIVLGLGINGSAAAYTLAKRGHKVMAFDARPRGHNFGSSHGKTRITRQAYFEAPEYVPMAIRATELWRQLEADSGRSLMQLIGGLFIGTEECELVKGSIDSAVLHGLSHQVLTGGQLSSRYPAFRLPADAVGVLEPNAGILHADRCLNALQDAAMELGAILRFETPVAAIETESGKPVVETESGETFKPEGLIVAAGPWTPTTLNLPLPLSVRSMVTVHFECDDDARFAPENLPVWCTQLDGRFLYGFPNLEDQGVKIGRHDLGERCTADTARRTVSKQEVAALQKEANALLPGVANSVLDTVTCLYTDTPDANFIVDSATDCNMVFMSGCSGHSFKFAPAMGEVLTDLVTTGTSQLSVGFLSASRHQIAAVAQSSD